MISRADVLEEMVKSMRRINLVLVADAKKVDAPHCEAAKAHARGLKEMQGLRTRIAEFEKAKNALEIWLAQSEKA